MKVYKMNMMQRTKLLSNYLNLPIHDNKTTTRRRDREIETTYIRAQLTFSNYRILSANIQVF